MTTPVMSSEEKRNYAHTRLLGQNLKLSDLCEIHQYNGYLPSQMLVELGSKEVFPEKVLQANPREPLYFRDGILYIPQWSGEARDARYRSTCNALMETTEKDIEYKAFHFQRHNKHGDFVNMEHVAIAYSSHAADYVRDLWLDGKLESVEDIILGPTKAVRRNHDADEWDHEYISTQLLEVKGKPVLNIGYVYGDQARFLADRIMRLTHSRGKEKGKILPLNMYMFGRVGALDDNLRINDLVYPSGCVDQARLDTFPKPHPFLNILAPESEDMLLNVSSVLNETMEDLERARDIGCRIVEMECREFASTVNLLANNHSFVEANVGFVGVVSDLPLKGITLAAEKSVKNGMDVAVQEILSHIEQQA